MSETKNPLGTRETLMARHVLAILELWAKEKESRATRDSAEHTRNSSQDGMNRADAERRLAGAMLQEIAKLTAGVSAYEAGQEAANRE